MYKIPALLCLLLSLWCAARPPSARSATLARERDRDHLQAQNQVESQKQEQSVVAGDNLTLSKAFHITGISGVKRNGRGDLIFTGSSVIFLQDKVQKLILPYERLRRVQLMRAERHYGKSGVAAGAASPIAGMIVMLKKRKVDTLVFDFTNEKGGLMGAVLQVDDKDGERCKEWLERFGVKVEEPPSSSPSKH